MTVKELEAKIASIQEDLQLLIDTHSETFAAATISLKWGEREIRALHIMDCPVSGRSVIRYMHNRELDFVNLKRRPHKALSDLNAERKKKEEKQDENA